MTCIPHLQPKPRQFIQTPPFHSAFNNVQATHDHFPGNVYSGLASFHRIDPPVAKGFRIPVRVSVTDYTHDLEILISMEITNTERPQSRLVISHRMIDRIHTRNCLRNQKDCPGGYPSTSGQIHTSAG